MKKKLISGVAIGLFVLFSVSSAQAAFLTFNFELPDWHRGWDNFGSNATVSVMVENNSANLANRTFNNSSITKIDVWSGSYFNSWTASDLSVVQPDLNVSYISTDDFGNPILDLTADADTQILFQNAGGMWQFGTRHSESGPSITWLSDTEGRWAVYGSNEGYQITGSVENTVLPEPSTLLLFGTGAVGFFIKKKRKL